MFSKSNDVFIGIDVSKDKLDIAALPQGLFLSEANDEAGIGALVTRLLDLDSKVILIEATGGYENAVPAFWQFAQMVQPQPSKLPDATQQKLSNLATRRHQLIDMLVMEKNRLHQASMEVQPHIQHHIDWLNDELNKLDRKLDDFIKKTPIWQEKVKLLQSVKGIGPVISRNIIAYLPELGSLDRKKIAHWSESLLLTTTAASSKAKR